MKVIIVGLLLVGLVASTLALGLRHDAKDDPWRRLRKVAAQRRLLNNIKASKSC